MARRQPEYVIDLAIDETTRSSPALGQVDKLLKQSLIETQSLQVVRGMMVRDMLGRAQVTGVSKLTAAAGLRETQRRALPPAHLNGHGRRTVPGDPDYGKVTKQKSKLATTNITGPRLNLFILEWLIKNEGYQSGRAIMEALKATGHADHLSRLSGVFGLLGSEGFVKHHEEQGYRILSPGEKFAIKLRENLEQEGDVIAGGYLAPSGYKGGGKSSRRALGYKTMGPHMKLKK